MSWVFVKPDARRAEAVGLPDVALPVRSDRVEAIVGGGRVDLGALFDELEAFAAEAPDSIPKLEHSAVRIAVAAVDDALHSRNFPVAERYALRALRWAPDSSMLRVQLGRAQHGLGRHEAATVHWLAAVTAERGAGRWSPMLWMLTARALSEQGQHDAAMTLLDDVADMLPDNYEFWELRGDIRDRAERSVDA